MLWLYIAIIALVQGLTEFLPVSSSGHLILVHALWPTPTDWPDKAEKILDIAVHLGTLLAAVIVFRGEIKTLLHGLLHHIKGKNTPARHLLRLIVISSIPVVIAGAAIAIIDISVFDHLALMAWMTLIFGLIMIAVEYCPLSPDNEQNVETIPMKHGLLIGLAQILALIPGVSRSGITMITARALGYHHVLAARFSMLLGLVAISGAGVIGAISTGGDAGLTHLWPALIIACIMAFLSAWIAILLLLAFLKNFSFTVFGVYRVILGTVLLMILYL